MMKQKNAITLALLVGVLWAANASAAAFIKFDGVEGEALDRDHQGWSILARFSHAIRRPTVAPVVGAVRLRGTAILDDIVCIKELDKASPRLSEALLKGTIIPRVQIHVTASFTGAESATYYAYELKNVMVTSYSVSGSGQAEEAPMETMSLNFEEIKVTYTEYDAAGTAKGNVEYSWKVEEGDS